MQPLLILILILQAFFPGRVESAPPPCELHHYFDGSSCVPCTSEPCSPGFFRDRCTENSTADAGCIECTPSLPLNAFYYYGEDGQQPDCAWGCNEGYYQKHEGDEQEDTCVACTTDACDSGRVREDCAAGRFTQDAACVCPPDTYTDPLSDECVQCTVTSCPGVMETLIRCPGTTKSDVSSCNRPVLDVVALDSL